MISAFTSPASEGGVVKKYPPGDASEGRWLFPGRRRFGHFGRCLKVDLSDHIFACFTVHISGKRWMGKKNKSQNISVLWMLKREMKTRGKPPLMMQQLLLHHLSPFNNSLYVFISVTYVYQNYLSIIFHLYNKTYFIAQLNNMAFRTIVPHGRKGAVWCIDRREHYDLFFHFIFSDGAEILFFFWLKHTENFLKCCPS